MSVHVVTVALAQVPSFEGVADALAPVAASLTTIYLENNPLASDAEYKPKVRAILPHLRQLDANML